MGGAACAKIIINGRGIALLATVLMEEAIRARDGAVYLPGDEKIVELLNEAEDILFKATRVYLEGQNFKGPWPASMK